MDLSLARACAFALFALLMALGAAVPPAAAQDTTTANYGFVKIGVGTSGDTWGAKINANMDAIDASMKAVANAALPLTGGTLSGALTDASGFVGPLTGNVTGNLSGTASSASSVPSGTITAAMMASGAAAGNLGYTPLNLAGGNLTGATTIAAPFSIRGGNGLFLFDTANTSTSFYWYNNGGQAQLWQSGQAVPLLRAGGQTLLNGQDSLQLVRIDRGVGGAAGRITIGTAAPGALAQGEMYLQVGAIGGTQQATLYVGTN